MKLQGFITPTEGNNNQIIPPQQQTKEKPMLGNMTLFLPCSRISLVQGGVYCVPCGGWALVWWWWWWRVLVSTGYCLLSSFLLLSIRYVRYLTAIWWMVHCFIYLLVMQGYVVLKEFYASCVNGSPYFCGDNHEGFTI